MGIKALSEFPGWDEVLWGYPVAGGLRPSLSSLWLRQGRQWKWPHGDHASQGCSPKCLQVLKCEHAYPYSLVWGLRWDDRTTRLGSLVPLSLGGQLGFLRARSPLS